MPSKPAKQVPFERNSLSFVYAVRLRLAVPRKLIILMNRKRIHAV